MRNIDHILSTTTEFIPWLVSKHPSFEHLTTICVDTGNQNHYVILIHYLISNEMARNKVTDLLDQP